MYICIFHEIRRSSTIIPQPVQEKGRANNLFDNLITRGANNYTNMYPPRPCKERKAIARGDGSHQEIANTTCRRS